VNQINVFTSCEAAGAAADYIRTGLEYSTWHTNLDNMMGSLPTVKFTIMTTINILSITTMREFLVDMLALKLKHYNEHRRVALSMSFNMLHHPYHQRLDILPEEYHSSLDSAYQFLIDNQEGKDGRDYYKGFFDYEIHAFGRLISFMQSANNGINISRARIDFYKFFTESDKRRSTSFSDTFPALINFMEMCKKESDNSIIVRCV
jgi:hypothetical protein